MTFALTMAACDMGDDTTDEVTDDTYTVSGEVVDREGEGIEEVELHFSDGFGTAKTDENGKWNKTGLEGEVTIIPEKEEIVAFDSDKKTVNDKRELKFEALLYEEEYAEMKASAEEIDETVEDEYDPSKRKESLQKIAEEIQSLPQVQQADGDSSGLFVKLKNSGTMIWESDKVIPSGEAEKFVRDELESLTKKKLSQGIPDNKNGIIINTLSDDKDFDYLKPYLDSIVEMMEDIGYVIDRKDVPQAKVELFKELDKYGLILKFGHGNVYPEDNIVSFETGEEASWREYLKNNNFINNKTHVSIERGLTKGRIAINNNFIEEHNSNFQDSFILSHSCHGLGETHMAEAYINNGAKAYVGWTERTGEPLTDFIMEIFEGLTEGYTLGEAYDRLERTEWEIDPPDDEPRLSSLEYYPEDAGNVRLIEPTEEHSLTIDIEGEGSTEPAEGTHKYKEGEKVTIKAVPDESWKFSHWERDVESNSFSNNSYEIRKEEIHLSGFNKKTMMLEPQQVETDILEDNEKEIIMNKNKYVKAIFVEEKEFEIIEIDIKGKLIGDGEYPVKGIMAFLTVNEDGTQQNWIGFDSVFVEEDGSYQFKNTELELKDDYYYRVSFWPYCQQKSFYQVTRSDIFEIAYDSPPEYYVEEVEMEIGGSLHLILKDSYGNRMKEEWIKVQLDYPSGGLMRTERTNEEGELYIGSRLSEDVKVTVSFEGGNDYSDKIFEGIEIKYREKTSLEVNFEEETEESFHNGDKVITTANLTLRENHDPESNEVWIMPHGTMMNVTGEPKDGEEHTWWPLEGHGRSGYAAETFLNEFECSVTRGKEKTASGFYHIPSSCFTDYGWEVPVPPTNAKLKTNIAYDYDSPIYEDNHDFRHAAVDFIGPTGDISQAKNTYNCPVQDNGKTTPVYAIETGTVKHEYGESTTYDNSTPVNNSLIVIEHTTVNGNKFLAYYGHTYPEENLSKGDQVEKGEQIGTLRQSGSPTHLHFEINTNLDPPNWGWGSIRTGSQNPLEYLIDNPQ